MMINVMRASIGAPWTSHRDGEALLSARQRGTLGIAIGHEQPVSTIA